jgi:hypothetical protein
MKTVEVIYIESGTFVGGEEDVYLAKIGYDEACYVVKKKPFNEAKKRLKKRLKNAEGNLRIIGDKVREMHEALEDGNYNKLEAIMQQVIGFYEE